MQNVRVIHVKAGPVCSIAKEELLPYMTEFRENMMFFMEQSGIRYDLVHANFWMSALVALELKLLLNIPFTVTFHALGHVRKIHQKENDRFPPQRITVEEQAVKLADYVIAECPQDREDLMNYYDADPAKITIIPCGFNPAEFYPVDAHVARKKVGLAVDEFVILQLGRMVPRKGVDNVIRSIGRLKNFAGKIRLVIVGGESALPDPLKCPEIGRLQAIAKEEGVLEKIVFTGRKDRKLLRYYYSAANVFVTTPWYEPFGITPLEAMACGTPVIGSAVGGIKYTIDHGKTGFLIPPNNPDSLADTIVKLFEDEKLFARMKKNAVTRVHTFFTWQTIAGMVSAMYEKIFISRLTEVLTRKPRINNISGYNSMSMLG